MITFQELHEQLMYNPWTGIFYWKMDKSGVHIGSIAGSMQHGYICISIKGKKYKAHRLAWFYVHGYMPENQIDHKDRIRHHNWIDNLREASNQCNQRNTGNQKNNTSGVKGIAWNKGGGGWKIYISVNNEQKYLGLTKDFDEAVCTRLSAEQCLDWEGCDSYSPAYKYVVKLLERMDKR